jgi:hypothetical protein
VRGGTFSLTLAGTFNDDDDDDEDDDGSGSIGAGVATLRAVRGAAAMVTACGLGERSMADFTFAAQVTHVVPP